MIRLAAPPLPLVCRSQEGGEEKWCSSHALIYTITGRLATAMAGQSGLDWQEEVLAGEHLQELLRSDYKYGAFCAYTREVLARLIHLDAGGGNCAAAPAFDDIRFLHDVGRVSWSQNAELCRSAVEFYCAQLALLEELSSEEVDAVRTRYVQSKRGYEDVLEDTMKLLESKRVVADFF